MYIWEDQHIHVEVVDIEVAVEAMIVETMVDIEVVVVMIVTDALHLPIIDAMITDGAQDLGLTHHVDDKTPTIIESVALKIRFSPFLP